MDTSESTAKLVDMTYKNIIDEFGPCTKQLVVAGRTYLKSLHAMLAASRQYTEALTKIANMASNSTLKGSCDIGSTIYDIVDVNKELLAHQSNIIKSLEFDFLEPMEIAADKDTKLVGREQKRFHQLYKGRKEAYLKCVSTLKKTRRKKNVNTDKQLAHMKMLESAKERLEVFCDDSLKEAIVQERIMYGTVLERQCALNQQIIIYHSRGLELLEEKMPQWESIAGNREKLPDACHAAVKNEKEALPSNMENLYSLDSVLDAVIRNNSIARSYGTKDRNSFLRQNLRFDTADNIYARPIVRAKSEYCLTTSSSSPVVNKDEPRNRFSRIAEYNGVGETHYVKTLYPYEPTGDYQLALQEGDIIEFVKEENTTGWQFGDNLRSKRSGWFPLSYTEPIKNIAECFDNYGVVEMSRTALPPAPPLPATVSSVRSKSANHQIEVSDYATLTRVAPKKLLPVDPPTVTASFIVKNGAANGGAKHNQQYASHPNIHETNNDFDSMRVANGRNYQDTQLTSMRL